MSQSNLNPNNMIFISYRGSASSGDALLIWERLKSEGFDAYLDKKDEWLGRLDWRLQEQIKTRSHFLIVLAPDSLQLCLESEDWVKQEIEWAMENNRNIVPILMDGFKFREEQVYLSGILKNLPKFKGIPLYHDYFDEGLAKITRLLRQSCQEEEILL